MRGTTRNLDLHGNAPDRSPIALLIVDVINDLEFEDGARLLPHALAMADRLAVLADRARRAGVAVIYANDNYGRWRSDRDAQLRHCLDNEVRGRPIARALAPQADDYYVVKPKHSAFYGTTLDVLFDYLCVETVIVTGLVTDRCVLFTASDVFIRDLTLFVPSDCVAAADRRQSSAALALMRRVLHADTRVSARVDFGKVGKPHRRG